MQYVRELVPGLQVEDCYDCADLGEILGDGPYNSPLVDSPDWFSPANTDSWEFCGFYPLEVEGIDDGTRTAAVTELALDGAMVSAPRYASREIRVTGLLVGATDAAVNYGLRWLAKALEGSACRDATGCTGDHLCYYSACPPMCTDSPALDGWDPEDPDTHPLPFYLCDDGMITTAARACSIDYERTLYQVTMTSGPTVVEQYNSTCGSMLRIEFTLVAGVPFAFSTAISAAPGRFDIPPAVMVPEVSCTAGEEIVVRTNLATNPVPSGNAAVTGGGWQRDGTGFTVTPDTSVSFDPDGGGSVRIERTAVTARPNLATNPAPSGSLAGWSWQLGQAAPSGPERRNLVPDPRIIASLNRQGTGVTAWTATNMATGGMDGLAYKHLDVTSDTTGTAVLGSSGAAYPAGSAAVTAGVTYTATMDVRVSRAAQVRVRLVWRDAAWGFLNAQDIDYVTATPGQWQRLSVTGLAPAGTVYAQAAILVGYTAGAASNLVAGDTVDVGRRMVEETTEVRPYFDGDTADTAAYRYSWEGEEDNSVSVAEPVSVPVVTSELATGGGGPNGQTSYMHNTVVDAKYGGQDGPVNEQAASEGVYTFGMSVRSSAAVRVQLFVTALDDAGQVLASSTSSMVTLAAATWATLGPVVLRAPAGTTRVRVAALMPGDQVLPAGSTFDAGRLRMVSGIGLNQPLIGAVTYVGQHDNARTTLPVTPGVPVTASVYVGSTVDAIAATTVTFYGPTGLPLVARTGADVDVPHAPSPVGVARWSRPSTVAAVPPAGAAYMVVTVRVSVVRASGAEVGDRAWVTSALFEESLGVLSYFDGSSDATGNVSYEWTGTAHQSTSQAVMTVPDGTDGGRVVDPDCPVVPEPPRPPVINISCVDTPDTWRRYQVQVADDLVPLWFDAVPIVRLQTGDSAVRQIRIRFYPNPLGAPIDALDPCGYCGEFVVTYIPANSLMLIDGIRQWVSVTNAAGQVSTANHLLASSDGGPVSWPLLGCGVGYTLVVDVSPTDVSDLTPQICLAARA